MTAIVTRASKGAPLTHVELDANFTALNSAKLEVIAGAFTLPGTVMPTTTGTQDMGSAVMRWGSSYYTNVDYSGTLTGGSGVVNIGSGQIYKDASGNVGIGAGLTLANKFQVGSGASGTGALYSRVFGSATGADIYIGQSPATVLGYTSGTIGVVYQNANAPLGILAVGATQPVLIASGGNGAPNVGLTVAPTGVTVASTKTFTTANCSIYQKAYSVAVATWVTIELTSGSTALVTGNVYRVRLVTTGAATLGVACYVVYYNGTSWVAQATVVNTAISNYPKLQVSGTTLQISHSHSTTAYTIQTIVESAQTGNTYTSPLFFGADGMFLIDSNTATVSVPYSVKCTSVAGGIGYGAGVGSTATQATSKSTGVTLSRPAGKITMNAASLAAATSVSFVVTNTLVAVDDVPMVAIASGATAGAYSIDVSAVAAGSFTISLRNNTAGALAEAVVINFVLLKGTSV